MTKPSAHATSRTAARPVRSPSVQATRWRSSTAGGMGRIPQNPDVFFLKERSSPGISDCEAPDSGHAGSAPGGFAALSAAFADVAPHARQCHRCPPAGAFPYFWTSLPQHGHLALAMLTA